MLTCQARMLMSSLRAAASSTDEPLLTVCDAEATHAAAVVQITVTSNARGFSCAHGTKVRPPGRFPSDQDRSFVPVVIGVPAAVKAMAVLFLM